MKAGFLAFDQTPLLQIDGLNLVQKFAAVRCALSLSRPTALWPVSESDIGAMAVADLARKHGLYGADNAEATMIDILAEGVSDFAAAGAMDADPAALRKYLPRFERALGEKDFLAGDLSFADVLLFCKRHRVTPL